MTGVIWHVQVPRIRCHVSDIRCHVCHKSIVRKGTDKATNHLLIRCHSLLVRCHVWHVQCQVSTVRCQVSDVICWVSHVMSHFRKPNSKSQYCPLAMCYVRCPMWGVRCHMTLVTLQMSVTSSVTCHLSRTSVMCQMFLSCVASQLSEKARTEQRTTSWSGIINLLIGVMFHMSRVKCQLSGVKCQIYTC